MPDKGKIRLVIAIIGLLSLVAAVPGLAQPRPMGDDIFTPLWLGYDFMAQGKLDAAQMEFEKVIKLDYYNPYANNNLAVILEKKGQLQDAMTYLNHAEKFADQYYYKVDQVCLVGGLCSAVKPSKTTAEKSTILQVILENKKKLAERWAQLPVSQRHPEGK